MSLNYNYYDPPEEWDGRYIHFGDDFDRNKFETIRNQVGMPKPYGGFWASRYSRDGLQWRDFIKEKRGIELKMGNSFKFPLKKGANIIEITCSKDLKALPKAPTDKCTQLKWVCLDFEKMLADGVDAIEVRGIANDKKLYFDLYSWDCDSILIMNPDIIDYSELDRMYDLISLMPIADP